MSQQNGHTQKICCHQVSQSKTIGYKFNTNLITGGKNYDREYER